jgi:RNA polymerase sigma-70 factor (ECF subfamily)
LGDSVLVRQILDGDAAAGERWVADHYPRICRLLRHLTGSVDTAEDLAQQAFLKAWQALATFKGESSVATWLHRIAYREYTHWLRARREHTSLEDAADVADERAADALESVLVRQALVELSPEHRETFLLYNVQGLSVPEVAAVLDVPAGTVKSRLFTARQRLREMLGEPEGVISNEVPAPQPKRDTP